MTTVNDDKGLGMDRPIARRDFMNGFAITGAAALMAGVPAAAQSAAGGQDTPGYYPPSLTGLRGSHPGSFEAAHALRDGTMPLPTTVPGPAETYDLVIVGGGISGLSAAYFYRERKPDAKILILDNHDDFGGHAKRNEFVLNGKLHLMNGGTLEIDSPRPYSVVAGGLIKKLGIDPVKFEEKFLRKDFYAGQGLGRGVFFDRETFGADKLIVAGGGRHMKATGPDWAAILKDAPLTPQVKADIARIYGAAVDYYPGLSSDEKKAKLARISYADYLTQVIKADPGVLPYFQAMTHGEWGIGIDAVGALEVWAFNYYPGFAGLGLKPGPAPHMGVTASGYSEGGSETFHFPDGNASIARLLVRSLIPGAMPGKDAIDIVTAQADYAELDRAGTNIRIRLSSLAVHVRNLGAPEAPEAVEIIYARGGALHAARGQACVLASWNMMIPYLCPELPDKQKEALHYLVKTPLIYTSVAMRNWQAFKNLGVAQIYAPGSYHSMVALNSPTDIGDYKSPRSPNEPMLVHMMRTPCQPALTSGRRTAPAMPNSGHQLCNLRTENPRTTGRTLGPGGFDAAKDITAITVNRWPLGYAYEYNPLFDPDWTEREQPHVIGRQPFGRITIANSDSGAQAYTDSAIDQAYRAVARSLRLRGERSVGAGPPSRRRQCRTSE